MSMTDKMREAQQRSLQTRMLKKHPELAGFEVCWLYGVSGDQASELNFGKLMAWQQHSNKVMPPQLDAFLTAFEVSGVTGLRPLCVFARPYDDPYVVAIDEGFDWDGVPVIYLSVDRQFVTITKLEYYLAKAVV